MDLTFAQARLPDPFTVGDRVIAGIELRLTAGTTVTGMVRGLTVDELGALRIVAGGSGDYRIGVVDFDGRYEVAGLAPGDWNVRAEVQGGGRQTMKRFTVGEGHTEIAVDLEFGTGFTLTGTVILGDEPLAGAMIFASGRTVDSSAQATTSHDGTFRLEGLEAGTYLLNVMSMTTRARHREEVEITGDDDVLIEIVTARISGWVRDAFDHAPISGATLRAKSTDEGSSSSGSGGETDSRGYFTLTAIPEGSWKITAQHAGYGPAEVHVDVRGRTVEEVELTMTPTEGLYFEVTMPMGGAPSRIEAAVLTGDEVVVSGSFETTDNGRVRMTEVPPGSFELLVTASGAAMTSMPVVSPGRLGRIVLPPAGRLRLTVPELETQPSAATVGLSGPAGRPYRQLRWGGRVTTEVSLRSGRATVEGLEPGAWTLTVTAADGRSWSGQAQVATGSTSEVVLE